MTIQPCEQCSCPIQRTVTGDLVDGMVAHFEIVHPELTPVGGGPVWVAPGPRVPGLPGGGGGA